MMEFSFFPFSSYLTFKIVSLNNLKRNERKKKNKKIEGGKKIVKKKRRKNGGKPKDIIFTETKTRMREKNAGREINKRLERWSRFIEKWRAREKEIDR